MALKTLVALVIGASLLGAGCADKEEESSSSISVGNMPSVAVPAGCDNLLKQGMEARRYTVTYSCGKSTCTSVHNDYYDEVFCRNNNGTHILFIKKIGEDDWTERRYRHFEAEAEE